MTASNQNHDTASHRGLWLLAAPMMLSNVSIAVLGLVDTAVIGHLDSPSYLAGVAVAAVLFDFLYWGVTFLRMGTTGVVAQFHGADDGMGLATALRDSILIALGIAVFMVLMRSPIAEFGLALFDTSSAAREHARAYFDIKIWGAPGVLVTMVFIGWLIGCQNAKAAMWLAAVPCLVHAGLDILLVVVLELKVVGAAIAAAISAYVSAAFGWYLVRREWRRRGAASARAASWQGLRRLLRLNSNIFLRTLCLIATFAFFTRQGAKQGDTVLAANTVLLNFQMLTALILDGFANALEALVGRAVGARNRTALSVSVAVATRWSLAFAVVFAVFYAVAGTALIALLSDIYSVRQAAATYLIWAVASPLISVWCFVFDGIFIGATRGREMRNSMLVSAMFAFLPLWYFTQGYGNHGLWFAFMSFFAARGLTMAWYYRRLQLRGLLISGP